MPEYDYMHILLLIIPLKIQHHYNIPTITHNGSFKVEIQRGMCGLPKPGILVSTQLQQNSHNTTTTKRHIHILFQHDTRDISFTPVVNDFGIKYTKRANFDHLIKKSERNTQQPSTS